MAEALVYTVRPDMQVRHVAAGGMRTSVELQWGRHALRKEQAGDVTLSLDALRVAWNGILICSMSLVLADDEKGVVLRLHRLHPGFLYFVPHILKAVVSYVDEVVIQDGIDPQRLVGVCMVGTMSVGGDLLFKKLRIPLLCDESACEKEKGEDLREEVGEEKEKSRVEQSSKGMTFDIEDARLRAAKIPPAIPEGVETMIDGVLRH